MKQREKCSGPGFDAGRSTKSTSITQLGTRIPDHAVLKACGWQSRDRCTFDGPELVSTGQRVTEWTAR
jgi:hypothetical protein